MKRFWSRLVCLALCLTLFPCISLAEDCVVIDVDSLDWNRLNDDDYVAQYLTAQTQGIRVLKYVSDSNELAARVRLTLTQADTSTVVYDKNYGYVSGTFDSGDIYLPYTESQTTPYLISLSLEDWTFALPFMQRQPRLERNSACTYGVRFRDFDASLTDNWVMGTMVDMASLRALGAITVPVCASNQYVVGQATLALASDQLTVSLAFLSSANVEVLGSAVYCITDVSTLTAIEPGSMSQPSYSVNQPIDVGGVQSALIYVPISLSYDPTGLTEFSYDRYGYDAQYQLDLWNANLAAAQANFASVPTEMPIEDGWNDPSLLPTAEPPVQTDDWTSDDSTDTPDEWTEDESTDASDEWTSDVSFEDVDTAE